MAATEESDWSKKVNKVRKILIKPGGKGSIYFFDSKSGKIRKIQKTLKNYYENHVNFDIKSKLLAQDTRM